MVSTPSARVLRPRSLPSWTRVPMRALDSGEVAMALVKLRSILRQSTGNCWR